ncbi:MAG: single-stranded-DNA-specific exonuclease RecJ, partial [Burkholderiales bacterium]
AFERAAADTMPPEALSPVIETDGGLDPAHATLGVAQLLEDQIWGQGFPQPLFCDTFSVESQRVVGERHLKLRLIKDGRRFDAIRFNAVDPRSAQGGGLGARIRAAYRLTVNEFNGLKNVQLNVEHIEA